MLIMAAPVFGAFCLVHARVALNAGERELVGNLFSGRERRVLRLLGVA